MIQCLKMIYVGMFSVPCQLRRGHDGKCRQQSKHGPDGTGEAGPCDPDCMKCERERR